MKKLNPIVRSIKSSIEKNICRIKKKMIRWLEGNTNPQVQIKIFHFQPMYLKTNPVILLFHKIYHDISFISPHSVNNRKLISFPLQNIYSCIRHNSLHKKILIHQYIFFPDTSLQESKIISRNFFWHSPLWLYHITLAYKEESKTYKTIWLMKLNIWEDVKRNI